MAQKGSDKSKRPTKTFISFSSFASTSSLNESEKSTSFGSPVYEGDDMALLAASKKLLKKDPLTKTKAINEVLCCFQNLEPYALSEDVALLEGKAKEFLPFFVYAYPRLALDNSRKIREQLNCILAKIIKINKKLLQPYMNTLIGHWWLLTADPIEDVRMEAIRCFEEAIPKKKRQSVLHFLAPSLLECLGAILNAMTTASPTDEDEQEKIERVLNSLFGCLKNLMIVFDVHQNDNLRNHYITIVSEKLCLQSIQSPLPLVQKGMFSLLNTMVVTPGTESIIASYLLPSSTRKSGSIIFQILECFAESSASVIDSVMECFLAFIGAADVASVLWSNGFSIHKHLVPKLRLLMKKHPGKFFQFIIPIVGSLPAERVAVFGLTVEFEELDFEVDSLCALIQSISELGETRMNADGVRNEDFDICIVELSMLLLLRRRPGHIGDGKEDVPRASNLLRLIIDHATLLINSQCCQCKNNVQFLGDVVMRSIQDCDGNGLVARLARSCRQLQRATSQGLNMSQERWVELFWVPLSLQLSSLISSAYAAQDGVNEVLLPDLTVIDDRARAIIGWVISIMSFDSDIDDKIGYSTVLTRLLWESSLTLAEATSSCADGSILMSGVDTVRVIHCTEILIVALRDWNLPALLINSDPVSFLTCLQALFGSQWLLLIRYLPTVGKGNSTSNNCYPSAKFVRRLLIELLHSVCDGKFTFIASEACLYLSLLVGYCRHLPVEEAMIPLNVILIELRKHHREDYLSTLLQNEKANLRFLYDHSRFLLEKGSSNLLPDEILLLHLVGTGDIFEDGGDILDVALNRWESEVGSDAHCDWFIFTMLNHHLKVSVVKNAISNFDEEDISPRLRDNPLKWIQLHSKSIEQRIVGLFFARVRNAFADGKASSSQDEHFSDIITNWSDLERCLLPILPNYIVQSIFDSIRFILNNSCRIERNSEEQSTRIQPKKWRRHVEDYIQLVSFLNLESSSCFDFLPFQRKYWVDLLQHLIDEWDLNRFERKGSGSKSTDEIIARDTQKSAFFALLVVIEFVSADENNFVPLDPETVVDIWTCGFLVAALSTPPTKIVSELLTAYATALKARSEVERNGFCSLVLTKLSTFCDRKDLEDGCLFRIGSKAQQGRPSDSFKELLSEGLLELTALFLEEFIPFRKETFDQKRLSTPRSFDLISGTMVHYIDKKIIAEHENPEGSGLRVLQTSSAKVLKLHKEFGQDAYYTISPLAPGDKGREIQTEWHKILINSSDDISDEVGPSIADQLFFASQKQNECREILGEWSPWVWMRERVEILCQSLLPIINTSSDLSPNVIDGTLYFKFLQESRVFCLVLRQLASSAGAITNGVAVGMMGRIRGLVEYLLALDVNRYFQAWSFGVDLLVAIVATNIGVGHGLWLPNILKLLFSVQKGHIDSAKASSESAVRIEILHKLLVAVSALQSCSVWQTASEFASELIQTALRAIPSPTMPLLTVSLIGAMRQFWQQRANSHQSGQGSNSRKADFSDAGIISKQRWETEAFDLALLVFVEGLHCRGINLTVQRRVREEARLALHFCLLPLNRTMAVEILSPSNLQHFAPKLQEVMKHSCRPEESISENEWLHYRLTACKLLDVALISFDSILDTPTESILPAPKNSSDDSQTDNWKIEEDAENQRDRAAFDAVMGPPEQEYLLSRFSDDALNKLLQENRKASSSELIMDTDEDDESEIIVKGESTAQSDSQRSFSTDGSAKPQKIGLKRRLQAMRSVDLPGSIFALLLCMQRVDSMALKDWTLRARCGAFLLKSGILHNAMHLLLSAGKDLLKNKDVANLLRQALFVAADSSSTGSAETVSLEQLSTYALFRTICTLPAMVRSFWSSDSCSRAQKLKLSRFIEERVRNALVAREMALISNANKSGRWDSKEFQVKGSLLSGEITATYIREETSVEMKITLPSAYPLRNVEVTCTSRIGMTDGRWRRWVLQIVQLLSMQDGSVVDAALMWKCNIAKEFDGVEPCPICYCILHAKSLSLPTLSCPTCKNKFHPNCLFTWFRTSAKSKCVICQQEFFY